MYNKLWSKILDSSVWLTDHPTRIVWITLLASMDKKSFAHFSSIRNLARRAYVTDEEAAKAIAILESPDPESETSAEDGRRIRRVEGGWFVINGEKYNKLLIEEHKKELNRDRVRRFRGSKHHDVTSVTHYSITGNENTCSESDSVLNASKEQSFNSTECGIAVCQQLGLAGNELRWLMRDAIDAKRKTSDLSEQEIAERMVDAWRAYQAANPKGTKFAKSVKTFFSTPDWDATPIQATKPAPMKSLSDLEREGKISLGS